MRIIIRQCYRGAAVLLENGEDVLEEIELQCQCGSHLLVVGQKSSRLMSAFEVSPASLTIVTLLFLRKGGLSGRMPLFAGYASQSTRRQISRTPADQ